jgi:hypothetical protein
LFVFLFVLYVCFVFFVNGCETESDEITKYLLEPYSSI